MRAIRLLEEGSSKQSLVLKIPTIENGRLIMWLEPQVGSFTEKSLSVPS